MRKLLKILAVILVVAFGVFLSIGCDSKKLPPCITPDSLHDWGSWEKAWEKPNAFGYLKQVSNCKRCGVARYFINR